METLKYIKNHISLMHIASWLFGVAVGIFVGASAQIPLIQEEQETAAKMSDVIRCYSDNNPKSDILEYCKDFDMDTTTLKKYVYAY